MPGDKEKTNQPGSTERREEPSAARATKGAAGRPGKSEAGPTGPLDNLGQLREILFGAIQRDLERRLARADAHLATRAHELDQETRRRTDAIEAHLRKETESLNARLERELLERSDTLRAVVREHRESLNALEQRVAKVEEGIVHAQRDFRHEVHEQTKRFLDEIQALRRDFADMLERELGLAEIEEEARGEETRPAP